MDREHLLAVVVLAASACTVEDLSGPRPGQTAQGGAAGASGMGGASVGAAGGSAGKSGAAATGGVGASGGFAATGGAVGGKGGASGSAASLGGSGGAPGGMSGKGGIQGGTGGGGNAGATSGGASGNGGTGGVAAAGGVAGDGGSVAGVGGSVAGASGASAGGASAAGATAGGAAGASGGSSAGATAGQAGIGGTGVGGTAGGSGSAGCSDSIRLGSTDARVSFPSSGLGVGTGPYTLEFWIRQNDSFTAGCASGVEIWVMNEANAVNSFNCRYDPAGATVYCWAYDGGAGNPAVFTPSIANGAWHHVAFVREMGTQSIYLDGQLGGSNANAAALIEMSSLGLGRPSGYPTQCAAPVDIGPTRFSSSLRYSGPFVPATSWAVDGTTVAQFLTTSGLSGATVVDEAGADNTGTVNAGLVVPAPGPCLCTTGLSSCPSGCADLATDAKNCGACGKPCAGACVSGACQVTPSPSCQGLAPTCGSSGTDDCCASPLVPGGTFNLGRKSGDPDYLCDASAGFCSASGMEVETNEEPSIVATVASYRLDAYEVTVGRFRKFVAAYDAWRTVGNPAAASGKHTHLSNGGLNGGAETGWDAAWDGNLPATANLWGDVGHLTCDSNFKTWTPNAGSNENRPINCVAWYDAYAFCIWDGGFLPSEAEWEYAAAGGSEERVFPWSSPPSDVTSGTTYAAYSCGTGVTCMINVGTRPLGTGKFGQADLAGNVWEWTLDLYNNPYPTIPCDNCYSSNGTERVFRGGSWDNGGPTVLRATIRFSAISRDRERGFRCARAP